MSDKDKGLMVKYKVDRVDGKPMRGEFAIVLEGGDPNCWDSIETFARSLDDAGYHNAAKDIRQSLAKEKLAYLMMEKSNGS